MPQSDIHIAAGDRLSPAQLYAFLRLRAAVFIVEQQCVWQDLDGRDLAAATSHLWSEGDGRVLSYLRVDRRPGSAARIGRVCTERDARGRGLSGRLMEAALGVVGGGPVELQAQAHLHDWYARLGFVAAGEEYVEDGIPHVDMTRMPYGFAASDPRALP